MNENKIRTGSNSQEYKSIATYVGEFIHDHPYLTFFIALELVEVFRWQPYVTINITVPKE